MITNKKIFSGLLFLLSVFFLLIPGVQGKTKPYYKGDAISYNNVVIIGSINMEAIELFKLDNGRITRVARIESFRHKYSGYESYYDLMFNIEKGRLYAYAVDGTYFYKYDISDPSSPALVKQIKDNSWDYFLSLKKRGDNIVTVGTNGVKIWNENMDSIDLFKIVKPKDHYNLFFSKDGTYIYNLEDGQVKIFDTNTRSYVSNFEIVAKENHNRNIYNDGHSNAFYMVDDYGLKMLDYSGNVIKLFKHTSSLGYEVSPSTDGNYVYFSDGIGIVKSDKDDLRPVKWAYTTGSGGQENWAMGLKVVNANGADYVVVFNNSNILVLNSNLKELDSYEATVEDTWPTVKESLFLNVDKNRAPANSSISLHGGGFGANEPLEIMFVGIYSSKIAAVADDQGRFLQILQVPDIKSQSIDIRVDGLTTKFHYNIGFLVE